MILDLKPDTALELALAKITEGKRDQLFAEYFAKVGPILGEYGATRLAGLQVIASNDDAAPEMGVLFQWPSVEAFDAFHDDPRFKTLVPVRDAALDYLSNAHFFDPAPGALTLAEDRDYLIAVTDTDLPGVTPLLDAPLQPRSPDQTHAGRRLILADWTESVTAPLTVRVRVG